MGNIQSLNVLVLQHTACPSWQPGASTVCSMQVCYPGPERIPSQVESPPVSPWLKFWNRNSGSWRNSSIRAGSGTSFSQRYAGKIGTKTRTIGQSTARYRTRAQYQIRRVGGIERLETGKVCALRLVCIHRRTVRRLHT